MIKVPGIAVSCRRVVPRGRIGLYLEKVRLTWLGDLRRERRVKLMAYLPHSLHVLAGSGQVGEVVLYGEREISGGLEAAADAGGDGKAARVVNTIPLPSTISLRSLAAHKTGVRQDMVLGFLTRNELVDS